MLLHDYVQGLVGKNIFRKTCQGEIGPFEITGVDHDGITYRDGHFYPTIYWIMAELKLYRIADEKDGDSPRVAASPPSTTR